MPFDNPTKMKAKFGLSPVSYTHQTQPTNREVKISVVAVS